MARLLLGVSGGIAAYKALEVVRLATKAGHAVRAIQTPDRPALRRRRLVRGADRRPGADRRVRARPRAGRVPRPGAAGARSGQPPRAGPQRRRLPDRAGVGQHHRQARPRAGRQPADQRGAGRVLPGARRARDEPPHVGAPGDAGQPRAAARARRDDHRARAPARWPPSTSGATGRLAELAELVAAFEAVRRPRARARGTACGCSSPPAARASRSTPCATSATARRGRMGFAVAEEAAALGAEVTVIAANVALRPPPAGVALRRRRDRRAAARRLRRPSSPACDVLVMAAAVADFRPAARRRRQGQEDGPR